MAAGSTPHDALGGTGHRLAFADGLRGIAALWVVLFHCYSGGHLAFLTAVLPDAVVMVVFAKGHLGVPIFFVLSGFVMALTVHDKRVGLSFAVRFVARRMIRLTPPFWASIAVVVALLAIKAALQGTPDRLPDASTVVANAAFVADLLQLPLLSPVYWTLGIEVQFYVVFAVLMVLADRLGGAHREAARTLLFAVTATLVLAWPAGLVSGRVWPGSFLPFWSSFAAGVLACQAWKHVGIPSTALAFLGGFGLVAWFGGDEFALVACAAATSLLLMGRRGLIRSTLRWRWLQGLGTISFSLYLLHAPLTGAGFFAVRRLLAPGTAADAAGLAASLALCIGASWLAYRWVEAPAQRLSRSIRLRDDARAPASPLQHRTASSA